VAKKKQPTQEDLRGAAPDPEGILSKAQSIGLSGLQTAGNILGVPGSIVKNTIGGADPFAALKHPLSGEGRLEGRDLLRQAGAIGSEDTYGNWWAGLGVDIATDPLTFFTGPMGALSKAGKVGRAAGVLDDAVKVATKVGRAAGRLGVGQKAGKYASRARTTLGEAINYGDEAAIQSRTAAAKNAASKLGLNYDELVNQPLGGVSNVWIPGLGSYTLGAGEGGAAFLEGMGSLAGLIPGARLASAAAGEAGRGVKGLFHGPSGGRFDKYGQEISELAYKYMQPAKRQAIGLKQSFRKQFAAINENFTKIMRAGGNAAPSGLPFSEGDLVKAADRGNYGYVTGLANDGAEVHFTNPETMAEATVKFPFDQLAKASSADLPDNLRYLHSPSARVLDRMVRLAAETKDLDAAWVKYGQGRPLPDDLRGGIEKLVDDLQSSKEELWLRHYEMGGTGRELGDAGSFDELTGLNNWLADADPTHPLYDKLSIRAQMLERIKGAGDDVGVHKPLYHFPRYRVEKSTGPLDTNKLLPTGHPSLRARDPEIRYIPAHLVEALGKLEKYKGKDAAGHIAQDFQGYLGYPSEKGYVSIDEHLQKLVKRAAGISGEYLETSAGGKARALYNTSLNDHARYTLASHKRNASFRAIHEAFSQNLGQAGVGLEEAFEHLGMDQERALSFFSKISGLNPERLATAKVPVKLVNAAAAVVKTYENPEWAGLIAKTLDTVNRYFKPGMVLVKPAFWVRNHTSGQYANLVSGYIESLSDVLDYVGSYREALKLAKRGGRDFQDEIERMGIMGADSTLEAHASILGGSPSPMHPAYPQNPLRVGQTSKEVWSKMLETDLPPGVHPRVASATAGMRHKAATWMATNAKFNRAVEYQNRASLYIYLKRKGFTPEAAAQAVNEIHFDYSKAAMAPFERDVMQRIVPFYVFSRNSLPWTVQRLLTHPGGAMSRTIQAVAGLNRQDELSPEYLSETASIPLGNRPDGSASYLTGLGLGFEDPAGFATPSLKQVGLEALSRTSPVIKGPLEMITGQSFFQKGPRGGRDLETLDPVLGRTLANVGKMTGLRPDTDSPVRYPGSDFLEHAISNSPLSGVATSLRTLTDTRKDPLSMAVNLGTGFRRTDVSPASQDRELRNRIQQVEKRLGSKVYSDTYIPKEVQAKMSPEELRSYQQLEALRRLLKARSEARRDAK